MYNFNFLEDEHLVEIFDEVIIKKDNIEKITTIALTNKRLLFLDYIADVNEEFLRIAKGVHFIKYKEIYYQTDLKNIKSVITGDFYKVIFIDNISFEFNDERLYEKLLEIKNINAL